MNIAIFQTMLPEAGRKVGGVDVAVHQLANHLADRSGDLVTVFSLTPAPEDARYRHIQLFRDYPILQRRAFRLVILPIILNVVDFRSYDIVHFHGDDWFYFRGSTPKVRTFHGSAIGEARSASSRRRRISQYYVHLMEKLSAHTSDMCLYGVPGTIHHKRVRLVPPYGIDDALFHPGTPSTVPTVLFVGTQAGRKRGGFLVKTFLDCVLPVIPNARLLLVSDQTYSHPSVQNVIFPPDDVLAALYREAWVFGYPSLYEGFGMCYLEAMATDTAIVTSDNPGAEHLLEQGIHGRIVDDDMLGPAIVELLTNEERRMEYVLSGRRRAREFDWAEVVTLHRNCYLDAIRRSGRGSSKGSK
jgi:phosphatidyl-myo-inositol alpha-mannosyltransferase